MSGPIDERDIALAKLIVRVMRDQDEKNWIVPIEDGKTWIEGAFNMVALAEAIRKAGIPK